MGPGTILDTRWNNGISVVGFAATVAYAVVGTLFVLVWNPLAAVPGASLDEIRAGLDSSNESLAAPLVLMWGAVGVGLAAAIHVGLARRHVLPTRQLAALYLCLWVFGAPSLWFASFPAGMGLADAFGTTGGDHSPWGVVLGVVSALALTTLVVMGVWMRMPPAQRRTMPS